MMMAVDVVEAVGLEALEATNADDAVLVLEGRSDIAVVLTDVEMPGTMNGLALAASVRERWPLIGIIVVSGRVTISRDDLPERGVFFPKHYDVDDLAHTLRRILVLLSRPNRSRQWRSKTCHRQAEPAKASRASSPAPARALRRPRVAVARKHRALRAAPTSSTSRQVSKVTKTPSLKRTKKGASQTGSSISNSAEQFGGGKGNAKWPTTKPN